MKRVLFAAAVFTGIAIMSTGFASELQEGQRIRLEPAAIQLSGTESHDSSGHQRDWQAGNDRQGQFENEGQGRPARDNNGGGQPPEPPRDENGNPLPPPDGGHGGPHRGGHEADRGVIR